MVEIVLEGLGKPAKQMMPVDFFGCKGFQQTDQYTLRFAPAGFSLLTQLSLDVK